MKKNQGKFKPNKSNLRLSAGSSYQPMFNEDGETPTPPVLNLNEFPSLTTLGAGDQAVPVAAPPPGSKPYVGMVKQPSTENSEFIISTEDFPALPGTSETSETNGATPAQPPVAANTSGHAAQDQANKSAEKPRKGMRISSEGELTNIPPTMIANQFGMGGLLSLIRLGETKPSMTSLALGEDLSSFGLNLNSPDNLHLTFAGPWADTPCRAQDIDFHVPPEYMINAAIKDKLAPPPLRLGRYKEDLLFYLFYTSVRDIMQIRAAAELYNRDWRYHMEERVWMTKAPGMPIKEKTATYERGTYYYFDPHTWRKVAKEFMLEYSKLEGRPALPPNVRQ